MSRKASFLKQVPLFADLPPEELKKTAALVEERTYRKGSVIFHADDPSSVLFILKAGVVKISLFDPNGKETIMKILHPPDFFGEMSLLDGRFHSATITAITTARALTLPREAFLRLLQKYPDFALTIMKALSHRLRTTNLRLARVAFDNAYGKVARTLLELSKEHGERIPQGIVIRLPLTRQELADHVGVSRVSLHRVLADLAKTRCLIVGQRQITILNEALLIRE